MSLFFVPGISGDRIQLDRDESRHLVRVLRFKSGDAVKVTDGKGTLYHCILLSDSASGCELLIDSTESHEEPGPFLALAVALTKNRERTEWLIEKAVEIGIQVFIPMMCRHSERELLNRDRTERIMASAMKQSLRYHLPTLAPLTPFEEVVKLFPQRRRIIAHAGAKQSMNRILPAGEDALILIGPEGDFSTDELATANAEGFISAHLGKARLRTETAALTAVAAFAMIQ
ncbi:MAG: 16S rRNA (uracil(1498)-N(3))-methyltransferase [Bacteroidia bacterium]|nr:16S rRNA (uracil(1498)-N(3))-methyltransferase [Bacteroidia bacterium]